MKFPIVEVKTKGNLVLHGMLMEAKKSKSVLIFVHGTASNFYENYFMEPVTNSLISRKISVLLTNNSGSEVLKAYPPSGASVENFEDCVADIDAWIKFVLSKGYENIILIGHSLGTEKIVYYMNKGKHANKIKAIILLAFADSYGNQMKYAKGKPTLMNEAKKLVNRKKGNFFLTGDWFSHSGVLPKSAKSYINFFNSDSELSNAFPFHSGMLEMYSKISVPMLAVIGDLHEYTFIPIKDAIKLIEKENPLVECHQIKNCSHDFEGKEIQLTKLIVGFLSKIKA